MALAKDLSHLPSPAKTRDDGCPPDETPRFAHLVAEAWAAANRAEGDRPRAAKDARFRHSHAGGCSRALAYAALGVPESNPMDLAGTFTVQIGSYVHDQWQQALQERFGPDAEVEVKVGSGERAGHVDAVIRIPGEETGTEGHPFTPVTVVSIEAKTIGGFGYKLAIGERGAPQGPKHEHIVQAALNAYELDADEAVIAYWSKDSVSVPAARRKHMDTLRRFCAEWTFTRDQYRPIAEAERDRVDHILAMIDGGELPARKFPGNELPRGAEIVDPAAGRWAVTDGDDRILDTGSWWACDYCRWQDLCSRTEPGRIPVSTLVDLGVLRHLEAVK